MDIDLQRILEGKRGYRKQLAALPVEEKAKILEKLRARAQAAKPGRKQWSRPAIIPAVPRTRNVRKQTSSGSRFGGRATATGVGYEVRIASWIAVKMLAGDAATWWAGLDGASIEAITMQAPSEVDDIVVDVRGNEVNRMFVCAKDRSSSIALTDKSAVFAESITSLVRQHLALSAAERSSVRLVWAVPSSVGRAVTRDLLAALDIHRSDCDYGTWEEFLAHRRVPERKVLRAIAAAAETAWQKVTETTPNETSLRAFLATVSVEVLDFDSGSRDERQAETELRSHVAATPADAPAIWLAVEQCMGSANQVGNRITPASLRREIEQRGLKLRPSAGYAADMSLLQEVTRANLDRLREHTELCFGPSASDLVHIKREAEHDALIGAAKQGHLLLTGDPGSGKSGMIHGLAQALLVESLPVVLLLAEDVTDRDRKGAANLPGLTHPMAEVLANWPDGAKGYLITDALDAVRDGEILERLRRLLVDVKQGGGSWTVVASVREYDLKHGSRLRESFPGAGVPGFASNDFAQVAHFHLPALTDLQLDTLGSARSEIRPFIERARQDGRSQETHRSPFYLRLAAHLLRDGVNRHRVADWNSPAVLLQKCWHHRIESDAGGDERTVALKAICGPMVERRRMSLSAKQLALSAADLRAIRELRARGILQSPSLSAGGVPLEDEIRFSHHLLHDYAIAKVLIPETPEAFCEFATNKPLLPIFYRQSFLFALEEIWGSPHGDRVNFWRTALAMEESVQLHGLARILAPLLAARRVEQLADLTPLLEFIGTSSSAESPAVKAVSHLASGLEDAPGSLVLSASPAWTVFSAKLGEMLRSSPFLEGPLGSILRTLTRHRAFVTDSEKVAINKAARAMLAVHLKKPIGQGWRGWTRPTLEAICGTYAAAPAASEASLLAMMTDERLTQFPHEDLWELANQLKHFGGSSPAIVLRLFEAAFGSEPKPGQWREAGSAILSLRFQTSDDWNLIHHVLANYYEKLRGDDAFLMTATACLAWNAVPRRRESRRSGSPAILATFKYRGVSCELPEDYSHIWGREFEHDEARILGRFERSLRNWAQTGDRERLEQALDAFARYNRTSLMWGVFMAIGAESPSALGCLLAPVLEEPTFLSHPDYFHEAVNLFGALHRLGPQEVRANLERLLLALPRDIKRTERNTDDSKPSWARICQNRLLRVLDEANLTIAETRRLWQECQTTDAFVPNRSRLRQEGTSRTLLVEEAIQERGVDLTKPENRELSGLLEKLKPFLAQDGKPFDQVDAEVNWTVVDSSELAVVRAATSDSKMSKELWGHLVAVAERVANNANWPRSNSRWITVRRILLNGANDPKPLPEHYPEENDDGFPSWGWPAPRVDAAQGLASLTLRLGKADEAVSAALRRLVRDRAWPVRLNLVTRLAVLRKTAPVLMWELIDLCIAQEKRFSVLDACLDALQHLWDVNAGAVMARITQIAERAKSANPGHDILDTLAHIHLFQFLRTGRADCRGYVEALILHCDEERAGKALLPQLHSLRVGGWLTAGEVDQPEPKNEAIRLRSWQFLEKLLVTAQAKLREYHGRIIQLHADGAKPAESEIARVKAPLQLTSQLVDGIAMQLYFASGAFDEERNKKKDELPIEKRPRFWKEAAPLFARLAVEPHPHTAHHLVQTLHHLMSCAPRDAFLLAAKSIRSSSAAGIQFEPLAVKEVVKLIQRAIAEHPAVFQNFDDTEPVNELLGVLDLFVEVGWPEARALTHRLEEIYR